MKETIDLQALPQHLPEIVPEIRRIRHDLHAHPELGFEERRTQATILEFLTACGLSPRPVAGTGVVADLRPDLDAGSTTIALRADMDALPIHETTDLPHRSTHQGVAHKCGHDGHTAILLGVAAILAPHREAVSGNVRFVFQPAEEGLGGARRILEEGVLDEVNEIYGLHNWPPFPKGHVRVLAGVSMAATHTIAVTLHGRGGHGSTPEACHDPIVAAAAVISALQTVVSRGIGHQGGAVVSICSVHAGTTHNVIPEQAHLLGTVRTFSPAVTQRVLERIQKVVTATAQAHGVVAQLDIDSGYPILVNSAECVATVERAAVQTVGADRVGDEGLPLAAAEDFAYYTERIPGAFFFLGAGKKGEDTPGCHHPDFDFDDELLETGMAMFLRIVSDRFSAETRDAATERV